ncbi:immune inhibitor A [Agromyces sp. SYSU K20354]|uniref:immune inhibitor A domain-containing protein n=1 Tax=Agromyces cavernae TaxID=2898659 RepID=UPI001E3AAD6A|nr:immune inhibitor A domain-containing protein [Agromyces cavernae]MCD2440717.1 immune inhibitor A [Agromyces cavernae]
MTGFTPRARKRAVAAIPVLALVATGMVSFSVSTAAAADSPVSPPVISDSEYYMNLVAPRVEGELVTEEDLLIDPDAAPRAERAMAAAAEVDRKYAQGNPVAAGQLAKREAKSIKTGKSPKQLRQQQLKGSKTTQEAKLLTILVEFNEEADDDFTGTYVPTEFGSTECKPGNVQNGPLHNGIPNPADYELEDNNSMWVPDFSSEHFNKMLFSDEGITERVRTDLTGPDGKPGFDISGYTMKSMYEEMSRGAYTVTGEATPWITVPHSEAWYGASVCFQNDEGVYEAGAIQDQQGHPDNPKGPGQLPIDAVTVLAEQQPDFPWSDYDIEDQGDRDGDGIIDEPDGVIDHVVLVHAGEDKSGGGGEQGTYALWAHSSAVAGGASIPGTDLKLSNYIVQPEDSGVGVFAHEYGHDLGLPDLYDTSNQGNSDVDFWDLMSSGSHAGPIFQSMPTHMGLWDKWVLGWADPVVVNPGDDTTEIKVGQSSRPAKGSQDGVKVNLPAKVITLAEPTSGENMWYTGADQDWGDIRIVRNVDVPADAKFWMQNNYVIEEDWDYGFVEVSTDGGTTWTDQKVYNEDGSEATTRDGYPDPNGNLHTFGDRKYGLTGTSGGWKHQYVDLSAYAGQTVGLRLRMASDAAFQERGWFADDFALTSGATTVWSDDVETGDNGWTAEVDTFVDTTGPGWRIDTGTSENAQYYLVEWRNFDGFDEGLKYGYDTVYSAGAWKVDKVKYNAPGALIWYRDTTYGSTNHVRTNEAALPSYGAKGGLLLVDSHFDPLRRTGDAAVEGVPALNNLPGRAQSSDVAFGLQSTYPFTECRTGAELTDELCTDIPARDAVSTFTDDLGWTAGLEELPDGRLARRFRDGSAVVPSVGNAPYTTRIVDTEGNLVTDLFGTRVAGLNTVLGTGNPADSGVGYGTVIQVKKAFKGNTAALISITPPAAG